MIGSVQVTEEIIQPAPYVVIKLEHEQEPGDPDAASREVAIPKDLDMSVHL